MTSRRLARIGLSAATLLVGISAMTYSVGKWRSNNALPVAIGEIVELNGKDVHYWVQGNGPDVILLHGASGNLRDFTYSLAPKLAQHFRVIAFDRPGLGYSDPLHTNGESPQDQAKHLSQVADKLDVSQAVIVGHSFGGSVAMAWALERPDQAAALVSLAGAVNPWPGGLGLWYDIVGSRLGGATVVPLLSAFVPRGLAANSVAAIFAPDAVPNGYTDEIGIELTLRSPSMRSNARQVLGLRPHVVAMSQHYAGLKLPVEILHGTADTTVPMAIHSEPLARTIPGANLTILDGVGHMPHHADEDSTISIIRRAAERAGLHPHP